MSVEARERHTPDWADDLLKEAREQFSRSNQQLRVVSWFKQALQRHLPDNYAAPELLVVVKEFVAYSECHCTENDRSCAYCMGEAAIAKAEGR